MGKLTEQILQHMKENNLIPTEQHRATKCIEIKGKQSETRFLSSYGAPQGSILGGLLFLINCNYLPEEKENKMTTFFIEDTSEIVTENNEYNLKERLQQEANRSNEWMSTNKMRISKKKTKLIISCTPAMRRIEEIQQLNIRTKAEKE